MSDMADLAVRTRTWIEGDPDPGTRAELARLLESEAWDELADRMDGDLEFGTAGLRGAVEAGSNRMNRAVVIRTTAGLARHLGERPNPVVLGFDARKSSRTFAAEAAGVLDAHGIAVLFFDEPVPTPLVAFAARRLGAAAAIVITASHNPPADNGYKVYDANATQIVPPVDRLIADKIAGVEAANEVARTEDALDGAGPTRLDIEEVYEQYRAEVDDERTGKPAQSVSIAYTPIHGVGWKILRRLLSDAGHSRVEVVSSQRDPDGTFPTVSFPNPEEPGAMDEVMDLGTRRRSDLVMANDPDADRLAVAIPGPDGWRRLTGNQMGVLLADWLLEHWRHDDRPIVINSIVSSPMLGEVAAARGAYFEQTLTGFKWICNAALALEEEGFGRFAFGYEEALGFSVGRVVRDKDGLSAALMFADMAAALAAAGSSVGERLQDLYRRVGLWASTQISITRAGPSGLHEISAAMEAVGASPPGSIGGLSVTRTVDFREGAESRPWWLPATVLVGLDLEGGGRALIRPSGTEPKLKIYVDLPGKEDDREEDVVAAANGVAAAVAGEIGL